MAKLKKKQHIQEVLLKPRDRTLSCPDVTRCQLQVIKNTFSGLLTISDTGIKDTKMVRVGIFKETGGCDALIRIGIVEAGGPLAVGYTVYITTTITIVTITTVGLAPPTQTVQQTITRTIGSIRPGVEYPLTTTTVDTQTVNYDGYTVTTQTTTEVFENPETWERRLNTCVDPKEIFIGKPPIHMMTTRYKIKGETVILITYQADDNSWYVIVDRAGGRHETVPLRKDYFPSKDNLLVSAALSHNLQYLYIIESRSNSTSCTAVYHLYGYDKYSREWLLLKEDEVPQPLGSTQNSNRSSYVDRNGDVVGYWADDYTQSFEQYTEDGSCLNPVALNGVNYVRYYKNHTKYWGGAWNIHEEDYTDGQRRRPGMVIYGGDLTPLEENQLSGAYQYFSGTDHSWQSNYPIFNRQISYLDNTGFYYDLVLGSLRLGVTKDNGLTTSFTGTNENVFEGYVLPENPSQVIYRLDAVIHRNSYAYHDGYTVASVTAGGWVSINNNATVRNLDMALETIHVDPAGNYPPCLSLGAYLDPARITESTVDERLIIYPVNLGQHAAIFRSFSACDTVSGDIFTGALVQAEPSGDMRWHIYKNNVDVTAAVAACIGRPMDQLHAIYWRA